jgi:hypothetical protein
MKPPAERTDVAVIVNAAYHSVNRLASESMITEVLQGCGASGLTIAEATELWLPAG